ncbi:MAG TPA: Rne/Rng family ribonuclease [Pyrinomonadaceae bacterium]|nr:Rne/Rng family ribonuclease [Pyrinomonadaceae bacterium]
MSKEMIVSVNGREKKIAILDNGKVTEFYIERGEENSGIAGNIYKGRVQRVLPGMQSAFVSIGLERDAFLYVSDFFDEEEEIERIVMEKSKKTSPEEAKREANEQIDRARVTREKQMESVQEIVEPLAQPLEEAAEASEAKARKPIRDRGRGRKAAEAEQKAETGNDAFVSGFKIEIEDYGFERIVDDTDTGELFKDAFRQEAIVDQVRAVEFDMESTDAAEVGSLLGGGFDSGSGTFERIADEDDEALVEAKPAKGRAKKAPATKKSTRARSKKTEAEKAEESEAKAGEAKSKPKAKARSTRSKTKKKAEAETEALQDAEASVKEPSDTAEMSVRRGGRGRRRGGRSRRSDDPFAPIDTLEDPDDKGEDNGPVEKEANAGVSDLAAGNGKLNDGPEASTGESAPNSETAENIPSEPKDNKRSNNRRDNWESRERRPRDNRDRGRGQSERGGRGERGEKRERTPQPTISDLLREGQEILVQIAKEPIAKKGARITSHIALPGRFLVYMPTIEHLGVSRKIESSSERGRLRTLIQRIRSEEDIPSGGFIVRTAGIGISEEDLRQDARYLVRTWQDVRKTSEKAKSPALVHQDLDIVQRLLRDQMSDEFTAIRVDSEEEFLRTVEFMNRIQPRMVNRVKLYTRDEPILDHYGVQEEIDKALKPRVWLKSGGYLVINQTEALVAIDVNTGKFVGKGNARLEDTITKTNLEAVEEIARQIRLRDLGGIIVLDLIDMEDRRNRHKVSQALQEALQNDKSPTKVLSFNDFGLIIMTRKRVKQSLERTLCTVCEYCEGSGWVKSPQTVCFEILAESARLSKQLDDVKQSTLRVHPEVAKALRSSEREVLDEIEAQLGPVDITADPHIHQAQYDFAFV